jgi:hypothetical protein
MTSIRSRVDQLDDIADQAIYREILRRIDRRYPLPAQYLSVGVGNDPADHNRNMAISGFTQAVGDLGRHRQMRTRQDGQTDAMHPVLARSTISAGVSLIPS